MNKILITGARRCGTTFVGKVLSQSKNTNYFFEPFNKDQGAKYLPNYWYPFIDGNSKDYEKKILDNVFFKQKISYKTSLYCKDYTWWDLNRYDLVKNLFSNLSREPIIKRIGRVILKNRSNFEYLKYKFSINSKNIIYKDPLASLSAGYITKKYNLKTIVILRHPYSYYYSMKKQNWGADPYANFMAQKELYKVSQNFQEILKNKENNNELYSLIEYVMVYSELLKYRNDKSFYFIKHEDVSTNPINSFKEIYNFCDLKYDETTEGYVVKNTSSNNRSDTNNVSNTKRNSKELLNNWKGNISKEEMDLIKELTFDCIKSIYPEHDW